MNLPALNPSDGSNKAALSNFNIQSPQDDANIDSTKENSIQGSQRYNTYNLSHIFVLYRCFATFSSRHQKY